MACKNHSKKIFFSIFIIGLIIILSNQVLGTDNSTAYSNVKKQKKYEYFYIDEPERKDPFIAGLLSWSWTGLGHFYSQDYTRGSLFLATDILQKGLLVYMIFHYSDKYRSSDNDVVKWEDIGKKDRGIIIGYVFSILLVKIICVVDSVNSAEVYNRNIYLPHWMNRNRLKLSYEKEGRINVSMTKSFNF